jgi:hypothetical protein
MALSLCASLKTAKGQTVALIIRSNVARAEVIIDGESVGLTNERGAYQYVGDLQKGPHSVTLDKTGYRSSTKEVQYEGFTEQLEFSLREAPALLIVRTNVASARVRIDGSFVGTTQANGVLYVNVQPGAHELQITQEGFTSGTAAIAAKAGLTEEIRFTLEPQGALMQILGKAGRPALVVAGILFGVALLVGAGRAVLGWWDASFDEYVLRGELGRGGMATVYRAVDRRGGGEVALKVMNAGLVHDADLVRKFLDEGEALTRIAETDADVPIVEVYHYGREGQSDDGRPFLALELVEGENMLTYLRREGALSVPHALEVVEQVARGLAVAHKNQIWHRDVTPDNIILTERDPCFKVKLIDFGVAKHEYTSTRTLDGSITGKPPYMSPEQCRAEPLDARTDIYSLGVVFYALLTGQPPYRDTNPLAVMRMHEVEPIPDLPGSIPSRVRSLARHMLAKKRSERLRDMDEVRERSTALKDELRHEETVI